MAWLHALLTDMELGVVHRSDDIGPGVDGMVREMRLTEGGEAGGGEGETDHGVRMG